MLLVAALIGIVSVAVYFIHIGGRLRESKLSDEAMSDIRKIYKMDREQDTKTQERLAGNSTDIDSVASVFPTELHLKEKHGVAENLRSTNDT